MQKYTSSVEKLEPLVFVLLPMIHTIVCMSCQWDKLHFPGTVSISIYIPIFIFIPIPIWQWHCPFAISITLLFSLDAQIDSIGFVVIRSEVNVNVVALCIETVCWGFRVRFRVSKLKLPTLLFFLMWPKGLSLW